jgi:addiction module RelE/StbE family toxin
MRVVYTQSATADIDQIAAYISERNHRAAIAVLDAIEATAARLGMFPLSAATTDEPGVRMAPIGRYRYLILYAVDDEVRILRVIHTARLRPWEAPKDENEEE